MFVESMRVNMFIQGEEVGHPERKKGGEIGNVGRKKERMEDMGPWKSPQKNKTKQNKNLIIKGSVKQKEVTSLTK